MGHICSILYIYSRYLKKISEWVNTITTSIDMDNSTPPNFGGVELSISMLPVSTTPLLCLLTLKGLITAKVASI